MKVDRKTSPFVRIAISGQFLVIFSIFPLQLVTAFPQAAIGKGFLLSLQRSQLWAYRVQAVSVIQGVMLKWW